MVKNLPANQKTCVPLQGGSLGQEISLEKEMATHPSILVWKIPRAEKPGRLQSMGCKRVGHDLTAEHDRHYYFLKITNMFSLFQNIKGTHLIVWIFWGKM